MYVQPIFMRLVEDTMFRACAIGVALSLSAGVAYGGLLTNGGFEDAPSTVGNVNGNDFATMPGAGGNGSWDVWTELPGWTTTNGHGVEIQTRRTIGGADPKGGDFYVELDSHPRGGSNSAITQEVDLEPGHYRLSYWYQPRTSGDGDNVLAVLWNDTEIERHDQTSASQSTWVQYFADIHVETEDTYKLSFLADGNENTLGALLDDVELSQVPLPGALPLFGAGLAGLAYLRRRRNT